MRRVIIAALIGLIIGYLVTAWVTRPRPWWEEAPIPIVGCDFT